MGGSCRFLRLLMASHGVSLVFPYPYHRQMASKVHKWIQRIAGMVGFLVVRGRENGCFRFVCSVFEENISTKSLFVVPPTRTIGSTASSIDSWCCAPWAAFCVLRSAFCLSSVHRGNTCLSEIGPKNPSGSRLDHFLSPCSSPQPSPRGHDVKLT